MGKNRKSDCVHVRGPLKGAAPITALQELPPRRRSRAELRLSACLERPVVFSASNATLIHLGRLWKLSLATLTDFFPANLLMH